jgi:hypothetical protein
MYVDISSARPDRSFLERIIYSNLSGTYLGLIVHLQQPPSDQDDPGDHGAGVELLQNLFAGLAGNVSLTGNQSCLRID